MNRRKAIIKGAFMFLLPGLIGFVCCIVLHVQLATKNSLAWGEPTNCRITDHSEVYEDKFVEFRNVTIECPNGVKFIEQKMRRDDSTAPTTKMWRHQDGRYRIDNVDGYGNKPTTNVGWLAFAFAIALAALVLQGSYVHKQSDTSR